MASYTDLKNEETLYADIDQYPRYINKEEKKRKVQNRLSTYASS